MEVEVGRGSTQKAEYTSGLAKSFHRVSRFSGAAALCCLADVIWFSEI